MQYTEEPIKRIPYEPERYVELDWNSEFSLQVVRVSENGEKSKPLRLFDLTTEELVHLESAAAAVRRAKW